MRYTLMSSPVHHPYMRHVNRHSRAYEPKIVEGRGIWDNELREWKREPAMKSEVRWDEVRALNGLPPVTVAKVNAALRKAGHRIGQYLASRRVRGWGEYTTGALTRANDDGTIGVSEASRNHDRRTPEALAATVATYAETLRAAGFAVTVSDNGQALTI